MLPPHTSRFLNAAVLQSYLLVVDAVIPGGKLQAPVESRTCWLNGQAEVGAVGVVVVGVVGAQKVPFQAVFGPQPPGGGLGAVGVVVVGPGAAGQAAVARITEPSQQRWVAGTTGAAGQAPG